MSFNRILIAIDGSAPSIDAARAGFDLAAALSAKVTTIYGIDPPVPYSSGTSGIGIAPDELLQVASRDHEQVVMSVRRAMHVPEGTTNLVRVGHPVDVILQAATDWPADLIVIGSHGRSGLGRVLLGSVAESVVRQAPCPVLVVRKEDK
jgi:nucleotide-binding universal stress UspA family protein